MQSKADNLVDFEHPLIRSTANKLTDPKATVAENIESIFYFVRDEIKFCFPKEGDFVKASETVRTKRGQCNTKGTLFLALCKAVGIPARLHFSLISKEIQKGFFSGWGYWLIPNRISHSWIEVNVDNKWHRIDAYINDKELHEAAAKELDERGWKTGFSISKSGIEPKPSCDFRLGVEQFEQMAAVTDDHGVWDEPSEYYASKGYKNRPDPFRTFIYRSIIGAANRRVTELRSKFSPPEKQSITPVHSVES